MELTSRPKAGDVWYRIEDYRYAEDVDEWGDPSGSNVGIEVRKYRVRNPTPQGVRLDIGFGETRVVLDASIKRFADPTMERALVSFLARKRRQAAIYEARAADARIAIQEATRKFGTPRPCAIDGARGGDGGTL